MKRIVLENRWVGGMSWHRLVSWRCLMDALLVDIEMLGIIIMKRPSGVK